MQCVRKRYPQSYRSSNLRNNFPVCLHIVWGAIHSLRLSIDLRLHVNIFDTSAEQFTLPSEYFDLPKLGEPTSPIDADLQFDYEASPFSFWITRRSDPDSVPIFDTRLTSLPPTPIPPFLRSGHDPSLAFKGFPLVFEDRYLQVKTVGLFVSHLHVIEHQ